MCDMVTLLIVGLYVRTCVRSCVALFDLLGTWSGGLAVRRSRLELTAMWSECMYGICIGTLHMPYIHAFITAARSLALSFLTNVPLCVRRQGALCASLLFYLCIDPAKQAGNRSRQAGRQAHM
jgi:hypothetical protein